MQICCMSTDHARPVVVDCPSHQSTGVISWDNPGIPLDISAQRYYGIDLQTYHIVCRCLYEELVNEVIFVS